MTSKMSEQQARKKVVMEQKSIIEVTVPTTHISSVQPVLQACLEKTHDQLIGFQVYGDLSLFVVQLDSIENTNELVKLLLPSFSQGLISAFEYNLCFPIKIIFPNSNYQEAMRHFPLHYGESWTPTPDEDNAVCVCLKKPYLNAEQTAWQEMVKYQATIVLTW